MALADLSDNVAVVLIAYICVFVPWTAVASLDFISAQWKSVRASRHDAQYHLFFVIGPTFYIIFYIAVQAAATDYKEMAAEIVGLIFSLHHVARTVWAIVQLSAFRSWAAHSILALREHGIEYESRCSPPHSSAWEIADCLLVNEEVVDNQLMHGTPRCFVKYGQRDLRIEFNAHLHGPYRILSQLIVRFRIAVLVVSIPFHMLFTTFRQLQLAKKPATGSIRQVPHEPVELWLTWASVFVAQGLSEWISDFTVASDEHSMPDKSQLASLFAIRRDYFAAEVLASAVMHSAPPTSAKRPHSFPNPFFLLDWSEDSNTGQGYLTKQDLLSHALRDGRALPYGEPHANVIDSTGRFGYKTYAIKLQRVTEGMPDRFGPSVLDFDVERLEWLSILLYIGFHSIEQRKLPFQEHADGAHPGSVGDTTQRQSSKDSESGMDSNDLALHNLYKQLGFPDDQQESSLRSRVPSCSMFPFSLSHFDLFSPSNRLSLRCGEFVDTWLALLAGDDVIYLQEHDVFWRGVYDPQQPSDLHLEKNGFYDSFPTLRGYHHKLEVMRMDYQFARQRPRYHHLEHSLSFMGYSMEIVRTLLARWILNIDGVPQLEWSFSSGTSSGSPVAVGCLGDRLSKELSSSYEKTRLERKDFQTCLIAEVQRHCQSHCLVSTENSTVLMTLVIISFPSLRVKLREGTQSILNKQPASCAVQIDPHLSTNGTDFDVEVIPTGAPQSLSVVISFQRDKEMNENTQVLVSLERVDSAEVPVFKWESWRDAFVGRLEGHAEWQRNHGLPYISPVWSESSLLGGVIDVDVPLSGTSGCFQTWVGWKPFRPDISVFEIQSPGFLLQTQSEKSYFSEHYSWLGDHTTTGHFPYEERVTTPYSEASRDVLRHACLIVKEKLSASNRQEVSLDSSVQGDRAQVLLERALAIFSEANDGPERSIFLLAIGAVELGSFTALDKCMTFLTGYQNQSANIPRATAILKRYLSFLERRSCYTVQQMDERITSLTAIIPLFQRLVHCDDLSATVLPDFAAFVGMIPSFISSDEKVEKLRCQLRRAFMHCRDMSLMANLAHISFGKQRTWEKGPGGYVLRDSDDGGRGNAVVNIQKIGRYFPWKEQCGMALKRRYLERVVDEGNDENALINLAHLYRLGEYGVPFDWAKAYSLYERALKLVYRPDALYYQGTMAKDGGHGLKKNEESALVCFANATTDGFNDKPFVASSIVRLLSPRTDAEQVRAILKRLEDTVEESKNPMAVYNMALIYQFGHFGMHRDLGRSKELYTWAMELGDENAAGRLINFFYEEGADADLLKAVELTCRAVVDKHHLDSFFTLGIMVKNGRGVEKDGPLALKLFEEGMRGGEESSATNVAGMLSFGWSGVPMDTKKALAVCRQFLQYQPSENMSKQLGNLLLRSEDEAERRIGIQITEDILEESGDLKAKFILAVELEKTDFLGGFDGRRAHELFGAIVEEVSQIDEALEGELNDGVIYALAKWENEPHNKCAVSWEKILEYWEATSVTDQYPYSVTRMARNLFEGRFGLTQDIDKAAKLWEKAIWLAQWATGNFKFYMSTIVLEGQHGCRRDRRVGLKLRMEAAAVGPDDQKFHCVLSLLESGEDVEEDQVRAVSLLEEIITERGDTFSDSQSEACRTLAELILDGKAGLQRDVPRARELLELAIEKGGHQDCMNILGYCLYSGRWGFEEDRDSAALFFEKSIERDQRPAATLNALSLLAMVLRDRMRSASDAQRAMTLWQRVDREHGHELSFVTDARKQMARFYLTGEGGTAVDASHSVKSLEECIQPCDDMSLVRSCQSFLGTLLLLGPLGVVRDEDRALQLMRESLLGTDEEGACTVVFCKMLFEERDISSELGPLWKIEVQDVEIPFVDEPAISVAVQLE